MPALDEKQIQEKLYGQYRKGTLSSVNKASSVQLTPQFETSSADRVTSPLTFFKRFWQGSVALSIRISKIIPWQVVSIVAGSLIASAILFQAILFVIDKARTIEWKKGKQQIVSSPVGSNRFAAVGQPAAGKVQLASKPEKITIVPAATQTSAAKQKKFAVQVCTYEREDDAAQLVKQLSNLNFSPFYQKSVGKQDRTLYVVFLGSSPTYEEAKLQLDAFKRMPVSQQFQDAFIRSV